MRVLIKGSVTGERLWIYSIVVFLFYIKERSKIIAKLKCFGGRNINDKTFSETPQLVEALEIIWCLLKGTQGDISSKAILQLKKLRCRMMKDFPRSHSWAVESMYIWRPCLELLRIFHPLFYFLCGQKYATKTHAHILENIQKVDADQIKNLLEV